MSNVDLLPSLSLGKPFSHFDQLGSIEEQWNEIYQSRPQNSFFLSFDFIKIWYNCLARREEMRVYPVFDGDKIIGFLPLFLSQKGPFRVLSSLAYFDESPHPGQLTGRGYDEVLFTKHCMEALLSDIHGWDVLQYHCGYSFQPCSSLKDLQINQLHLRDRSIPTYTIVLPGSFEEYFNDDLSAKVRHNIRWWKKKLAKFSSHKFCHYTGDEAVASWPKFLSIEDSGWKGQKSSSIKGRPANIGLYYEGLIRMLSKNGLLHMYFLEIDGNAVAGGFGYVDRDVFHYAKIGYIEDNASFSPSNLLLMFIIEDVIKNLPNVKRVHMYPKDYGYKHRYVNEESFYSEATLYNRTIRGSAAYYLSVMKERFRLFQQRMVPATDFVRKHFRKRSI